MKKCSKCGEVKALSEFGQRSEGHLRAECRVCVALRAKRNWQERQAKRPPEKRGSRFSRISDQEFAEIAASSSHMREFRIALGYGSNSGSMDSIIKARASDKGVSLTHFTRPRPKPKRAAIGKVIHALEDILVEDSTYLNRSSLKVRLVREGLLIEECTLCRLPPVWNGLPLTLQLDHINGVNNDNRLSNLRLLCPNCHTQTDTHSGRNQRRAQTLAIAA